MIVCDASATVELLLGSPSIRLGETLTAREWHAPDLWALEVIQALRGLLRRRRVSPERAEQAVEDLGLLPVMRHPHAGLERRVWALRDTCSAYDAAYVVVAEMLGAPLVTADAPLARAAEKLVDVVVV